MPLEKGSSAKVIGANIGKEIASGRDPKQAAAIAYSEAGENKAKDAEQKRTENGQFGSGGAASKSGAGSKKKTASQQEAHEPFSASKINTPFSAENLAHPFGKKAKDAEPKYPGRVESMPSTAGAADGGVGTWPGRVV